MSAIVQRTNPDQDAKGRFRCAACRSTFDEEAEARKCAETDHETQRHKRHPEAPHYEVAS